VTENVKHDLDWKRWKIAHPGQAAALDEGFVLSEGTGGELVGPTQDGRPLYDVEPEYERAFTNPWEVEDRTREKLESEALIRSREDAGAAAVSSAEAAKARQALDDAALERLLETDVRRKELGVGPGDPELVSKGYKIEKAPGQLPYPAIKGASDSFFDPPDIEVAIPPDWISKFQPPDVRTYETGAPGEVKSVDGLLSLYGLEREDIDENMMPLWIQLVAHQNSVAGKLGSHRDAGMYVDFPEGIPFYDGHNWGGTSQDGIKPSELEAFLRHYGTTKRDNRNLLSPQSSVFPSELDWLRDEGEGAALLRGALALAAERDGAWG